jgi:hypothetical protein
VHSTTSFAKIAKFENVVFLCGADWTSWTFCLDWGCLVNAGPFLGIIGAFGIGKKEQF